MFSQRNNPYCDLLQISGTKIVFFFIIMSVYGKILIYLRIIIKHVKYEEDIGIRFGN